MIVSHRYKFIFIKTRKTAGTSMEVFLSQQCSDTDIVTPIFPHVPPHKARNHNTFYNHMPATEARELLPESIWNDYFKFCVERNPWDKTLSHYYYVVQTRRRMRLSFDRYLWEDNLCIDRSLYTDESNTTPIVDRVLKYENLMEELDQVFSFLGVSFSGSLNVYAKSGYRKDRRDYREVYTEKQRRHVEKAFAWEIQTFGYHF